MAVRVLLFCEYDIYSTLNLLAAIIAVHPSYSTTCMPLEIAYRCNLAIIYVTTQNQHTTYCGVYVSAGQFYILSLLSCLLTGYRCIISCVVFWLLCIAENLINYISFCLFTTARAMHIQART